MSTTGKTRNTTATLAPRRPEKRVVLANRSALPAKAADHFRKLGWEVHTVSPEMDVQAAAVETDPHAVLLPEDAGDESGYLTCAKLLLTLPHLKVVVVGDGPSDANERFAEFVGAEYVAETDGVPGLVNALS